MIRSLSKLGAGLALSFRAPGCVRRGTGRAWRGLGTWPPQGEMLQCIKEPGKLHACGGAPMPPQVEVVRKPYLWLLQIINGLWIDFNSPMARLWINMRASHCMRMKIRGG